MFINVNGKDIINVDAVERVTLDTDAAGPVALVWLPSGGPVVVEGAEAVLRLKAALGLADPEPQSLHTRAAPTRPPHQDDDELIDLGDAPAPGTPGAG